jgi:hypothetical protein
MLTVAAGFICASDFVKLIVSTVPAPMMKPAMPMMLDLSMGTSY